MRKIDQPEVNRDRWGRPVIDGRTFLRPSSLGGMLKDQGGLQKWAAGMTAFGMGRSPDLVALASTKKSWKDCADIAERAKDRAGAGSGRDTGTAIHEATEALDYGEDVSHLGEKLLADAAAYVAARESLGMTALAAEVFVANETLGAAGTFDRLCRLDRDSDRGAEGDVFITDIKSVTWKPGEDLGKAVRTKAKYEALSWGAQLATYAGGWPLGASWEALGAPTGPRRDVGVVWVIPRGSGFCVPVWVDLTLGAVYAELATAVHWARKADLVIDVGEVASA